MEDKEKSECCCNEDLEETCNCCENCTCGEECHCSEENKCNPNCDCCKNEDKTVNEDANAQGSENVESQEEQTDEIEQDKVCECDEACGCEHECHCEEHSNYFQDMLRIQAEFDNYRKRMTTALSDARKDGFMDAIEQFLPALDSFKMATDMITDKNTLMGIKFIEKGILDTLSKMGVEEIDATGKFNPEFHQAIDTEENDEFESGDIIKVASKGFIYKDKVIRYSQVIVKK